MPDLDKLAEKFEAEENLNTPPVDNVEPQEVAQPLVVQGQTDEDTALTEVKPGGEALSVFSVAGDIRQRVLEKAQKKVNSDKILEKHAENIANITDKAIEVDTERAALKVEEQDADNKVQKQEIKNRLIVLNAEALRLEREQKQLNKQQKAEHKARNKAAKWEIYKDKLTKMGYTYVPNVIVLWIMLFFDGAKSFFDGLGTVSTAIVKALKWVILVGAILAVLFIIPVTREWIINLLSGGH